MKLKPDFIIIGAQKCGTTNLWDMLNQHPDICMAEEKEPHYFTRHTRYPQHDWYRGLFVDDGRLTGEATNAYMFWPGAMVRMCDYDPRIKLIVILRNPTERAISHYWHEVAGGHETAHIHDALKPLETRLRLGGGTLQQALYHRSYLLRGLYVNQLYRVSQFFPQKQVRIITLQDLISDTVGTLASLCEFLGVNPVFSFETHRKRRKGDYPETDPALIELLDAYFMDTNYFLLENYKVDVREPTKQPVEWHFPGGETS